MMPLYIVRIIPINNICKQFPTSPERPAGFLISQMFNFFTISLLMSRNPIYFKKNPRKTLLGTFCFDAEAISHDC